MQYDKIHNESDLVRRIAEGDEGAFSRFYELNWQRVYQYLIGIVKSAEVCEELVADIFVKIWLSRASLGGIVCPPAYLRKMAKHKALDYLKMLARHKQREREYRSNMSLRQPYLSQMPGKESEIERMKDAFLAQLSPQRRKVFVMHREEGLSYSQIAEKLHISITTVKKTMSEALTSIHKMLNMHYDKIVVVACLFIRL